MNKKKIVLGSMLGVLAMSAVVAGSALSASADTGMQSHRHLGVRMERRAEHTERVQERIAIQNAIEKGDYSAWKEAMGNRPNASQVTQEEFPQLQTAHKLAKEGKYDEARQIRQSIGMTLRGNGQGRNNR